MTESIEWLSGSALAQIAPQGLSPLAKLQEWAAMAASAYPPNTLRAWRADAAIFQAFCEREGSAFFPAAPMAVRRFVEHCHKKLKKPATIRRYLATIARLHMAAGLTSPCASEPVRLSLKTMAQTSSALQRQARGLRWEEIGRFLRTAGEGIRADRERALLCVAYDTMARRSEIVALDVEDLTFASDGSGTALIRRSKTDQAGEGSRAYLSRETVRWLRRWLKTSGIEQEAVFRRLVGQFRLGPRLHADIVSDIYKRVGQFIGLPEDEVAAISGHSVRVGATQDLLALNIDLASVMQAGRWTTTAMPMRYGEHQLAARGGMARAAKEQGRDKST